MPESTDIQQVANHKFRRAVALTNQKDTKTIRNNRLLPVPC